MNDSIFNYSDYKVWIKYQIENNPSLGGFGSRKKIATEMNSQVSHLSSVLNGNSHLTLEQAERLGIYFGLLEKEMQQLLLLVQYNRAGTASLREVFRKQIKQNQIENENLKNQLGIEVKLNSEIESIYYSSWTYSLIHIILTLPQFQTRDSIAERLNLPKEKVDKILIFLVESKLCYKEGSKYHISKSFLHLDKSSKFISRYHLNWRLRAIESLENKSDEDFHYSAAVTLCQKDIHKIRRIISKSIEKSICEIRESKNEDEIMVLCVDFFKV